MMKEYNIWEDVGEKIEYDKRKKFSTLSIIIPTHNCAPWIGITLNSIINQHYHLLEVIVVDASSTDRTLEVVTNYQDIAIQIYSVKTYQIHEMLNRGISLATGEYVQMLFPGDFFVSPNALAYFAQSAVDKRCPDMLYCGCLLHKFGKEPMIMCRKLTEALLKKGRQPTSIQSCWFKRQSLISMGKFDTKYAFRAAFDLFCRMFLDKELKIVALPRVLLDYEGRRLNSRSVLRHFFETISIVYRYFGVTRAMMWICIQKDMRRLMQLAVRKCRTAFLR